ncbi:hypothetical protein [Pyruvatibacter mobilis]|uniref:hypothetical protein n=1 Tax=Pyruvatibacter mobilis TaxID=1712261 RepID=UPI003D0A5598
MTGLGPRDIATLISLNGGKLAGKTRLQKSVYLLQRIGAPFQAEFEYYHYGPYSAEVANAADFAEMLDLIGSREIPGFKSIPYCMYEIKDSGCDALSAEIIEKKEFVSGNLSKMNSCSAVVLELAATMDYLQTSEGFADPVSETKIRKPNKATEENIANAKKLLADLGIPISENK